MFLWRSLTPGALAAAARLLSTRRTKVRRSFWR